jgi:hypothetical protein
MKKLRAESRDQRLEILRFRSLQVSNLWSLLSDFASTFTCASFLHLFCNYHDSKATSRRKEADHNETSSAQEPSSLHLCPT